MNRQLVSTTRMSHNKGGCEEDVEITCEWNASSIFVNKLFANVASQNLVIDEMRDQAVVRCISVQRFCIYLHTNALVENKKCWECHVWSPILNETLGVA